MSDGLEGPATQAIAEDGVAGATANKRLEADGDGYPVPCHGLVITVSKPSSHILAPPPNPLAGFGGAGLRLLRRGAVALPSREQRADRPRKYVVVGGGSGRANRRGRLIDAV